MPIVKTYRFPLVEPPLERINVPGINSSTGLESGRVFEVHDVSTGFRHGICALLQGREADGGLMISSFVTVEQARAIADALNEFADRAEGSV